MANSGKFRLEEHGLGHNRGEFVGALFESGNFVGIFGGEIGFLGRVVLDVIELDGGGQYDAPDEFPIAFANAGTEWFDVVDDFGA